MHHKIQSGQRALRAAGIALALLGFAAQPAIAQELPAQEIPVGSDQALTVVRDADTGELRAATGAEQAALQAKAAANSRMARSAAKPVQQKFHASGARGVRLTDDFISTSVAVRKADGSIEKQCFDSHGAAAGAATAGHVHTTKVVTE
jgi:hypothetical protein